jgi:hypothetical protein
MAEQTKASFHAASSEGRPDRKAYAAPTLRRLGSVRELTLGSPTGCLVEGSGKNPKAKGGM